MNMKPSSGETSMHFKHRLQRAEARKIAWMNFPPSYRSRIWTEMIKGVEHKHEFGGYFDDPKYAAEYIKQLKIIRARRFA